MTSPSDNPLIAASTLPHGVPPFDKIKAEHFLPALKHAVARAHAEIDAITANPDAPTFANTIEALEFSGAELSRVQRIFNTLSGANSSDDIREMEEEFQIEGVKANNDIMMNDALFTRVKAVYDARASLTLTGEQAMLLDKTYKNFVRSGALLDAAGKQRLREVQEQLAALNTQYENNTVNATAAFVKIITDESELAGVPERAKNNYKAAATKAGHDGKWLIKLSPPPTDILEYCDNRKLREEIQRARAEIATSGEFDNRPVILDIVRLRNEQAQLLGYPTYAAYILDERMMKTPEAVNAFLEKNEKVYRPAADKFLGELKAFAKQEDGLDDIKPCDMLYYWRKLQEKTFNIDMEELRPYFDLEKVLDGMRHHAEKLFGIKMTETKGKYPVYLVPDHDAAKEDPRFAGVDPKDWEKHSGYPKCPADVKVYEITDAKTGKMVGLFYGDYYARAGAKRNGAWENDLRNGGLEGGEMKFAIVANTCNFDKPTKDQPTLLSIDEVRTVFHEFGHALHNLGFGLAPAAGKGLYPSLNGTNVKWDFVELPSQLQENWAQQKETLDTFAHHYKTGATLPAEMIKKIQDMDNFGAGYAGLRQTFLAMLDMKWHSTDPDSIKSVEALEDGIVAAHWLFPRTAGLTSTSFGHIFTGADDYAAGYNSYKVAEVLEADVFEEFKKNGLYHAATADRLRETIYSRGGTVDPMELFKQMMGREPDQDALFRREGLLPPSSDDRAKKPKPPTP